MPNVRSNLEYLLPSIEKPYYIMRPCGEAPLFNGLYHQRQVLIHDARDSLEEFSLDSHGFLLVDQPTSFTNFHSDSEIVDHYYPEMTEFVRRCLGAKWVRAIDHTIRTSQSNERQRTTARRVHNDYTEASALEKFNHYLGEDFRPSVEQGRLVQLNVWRPLNEPVLVAPLAIADGRSIDPGDLVACDVIYPDRIGENFELMYRENQRWFYYSNMMHHEVLLIKGYDSSHQVPAKYAPHSAFIHPDSRPRDPARWSIEIRFLVVL